MRIMLFPESARLLTCLVMNAASSYIFGGFPSLGPGMLMLGRSNIQPTRRHGVDNRNIKLWERRGSRDNQYRELTHDETIQMALEVMGR